MPIQEISWNGESEGASDLLNNPALADFKDINGLAKAFIDTKAMIGQSVRLPSKEAGEDDMKNFYNSMIEKVPGLMVKPDLTNDDAMNAFLTQIGKPDSKDGYELPEVDDYELSDDRKAFLAEKALDSGLTKKQFNKFIKELISDEKNQSEKFASDNKKDMDALQAAWGQAYESKMEKVSKIAQATGAPQELLDAIKLGVAGADTIKWIDGLVKSIGSEDFQISTQPKGSGGITTEEARERASEIRNKLSSMNVSDPSRNSLITKMMEYDKLASARI